LVVPVIGNVAVHPLLVYVIIVPPAPVPVTIPVELFTIATLVDKLDHVPPGTLLDRDAVDPIHKKLAV
jgi:hypothetical protein